MYIDIDFCYNLFMIHRLWVCVSSVRKRDKVEREVKDGKSNIEDWIVEIGKFPDISNSFWFLRLFVSQENFGAGRSNFPLSSWGIQNLKNCICKKRKNVMIGHLTNLVQHIGEDDETGVDQIEYQPHLHWLDGGGRRQTSGYIKIYWGQHHHTGSKEIRIKQKVCRFQGRFWKVGF